MKLTLVFLVLCGTTLQIVKSKDLIPSIDNPMVPSMGSPLSWPENAETMYDSTLTGYRFLKFLNSAASWGHQLGNSMLDSASKGIQWLKDEYNDTPIANDLSDAKQSLKNIGSDAVDSIENGASEASDMIRNKASQTADELKSATSPIQTDSYDSSRLAESMFN